MRILPIILFFLATASFADEKEKVPYSKVHAVFAKHCLSCHDVNEAKGELILENHETLTKGGESGAVVLPGRPDDSLLVKLIEHKEKPFMPPPKKADKLGDDEIALVRKWVEQGAVGGDLGDASAKPVVLPKIAPKVEPRKAVQSVESSPVANLLAIARHNEITLLLGNEIAPKQTLTGHAGNVNKLAFNADGKLLAAASGLPGVSGEVRLWNTADGKLVRTFAGHTDAVYGVAISPDGQILASGGYDQKIILWNLVTGEKIRELKGHNGCVFDLAFRPDGKILASASADRTVKLWNVADGKRLDTFTESLKDLYSIAFSPDGKRVAAAGVDNRIRVWLVSDDGKEGTNPILYSVFAHEGALLRIAYSPDGKTLLSTADDRTVKLWNAADITQRLVLEKQLDWPTAACFNGNDKIIIGRADGSIGRYHIDDGKPEVRTVSSLEQTEDVNCQAPEPKPPAPPPAPVATSIWPRGIQSGVESKIKLTGNHLAALKEIKFNHAGITAKFEGELKPTEATLLVTAGADVPPGAYTFTAHGDNGASGALRLDVDNIPQVVEAEPNNDPSHATHAALPVSFWGVLPMAGGADYFSFDATKGQNIVADLAGQRLGAKLDGVLTLFDAAGRVLASNNDTDGLDPLLAYTLPADGRYTLRVTDFNLGASGEHFYRLSVGAFAYVTGVYPMSVPDDTESSVQLVGYNLPAGANVKLPAQKQGEIAVPVDANVYRSRKAFAVMVDRRETVVEAEPNDSPALATPVPAPGVANGRIFGERSDRDLYRFTSKAGQQWVIETLAARRGSPVDTRMDILDATGKPVPRLLLRAVRDSSITFRNVESNAGGARLVNWEEMNLNDHVYIGGEVVKIFRAPRGPDSETLFYQAGGGRKNYFDTSGTRHALDEAAYVVEPHPLGSTFPPNGLPTFTLNYANDDDGERKIGVDSRVHFTAPADGEYLVRVTDTRGFSGDRYTYRLSLRPAKPDFNVSLSANAAIPGGSARQFTVSVDRVDGFEGAVNVNIEGLPPGFTASNPLVIEAGHNSATGTLYAAPDAPAPTAENQNTTKLTATATLHGQPVTKPVNNFGVFKLEPKPQLVVALLPEHGDASKPMEITVEPGKEAVAILRVERNGYKGLVTFEVENLPHGMIVSDIGLNGVLIPEDQSERRIFLHCAPWVAETDRPCYAQAQQAGNPTSRHVIIRVRKPVQQAQTKP